MYKPPTAEMIAYLDFSVSTTGMLTGVKVKYIITTFKHGRDSVINLVHTFRPFTSSKKDYPFMKNTFLLFLRKKIW